jgi:hypothetical protein
VRSPGTVRATLAAALLLAIGLFAVSAPARATHQPTTEQVVAVATSETFNMACSGTDSAIGCYANDFDGTWSEYADIRPGSGPLLGVGTELTVFQIPPQGFDGWFQGLQGVACAPDRISAGQLSDFIATVTSRREAGTDGPVTIVDECTLSGGLRIASDGSVTQYTYWVQSAVLAPSATATPTPTSRATVTPTQRASARATPVTTQGATSTATASASIRASATASASASASATAVSTAPATPEQSVLAGNPSPTPSFGQAAAPGSRPPAPPHGTLIASVTPLGDISLDPVTLGGSAALAIVLLLFMAFASELFNDTFEANYDEIARWLHLLRRAAGEARQPGMARIWTSPAGIGLFLAIGAGIYVALDPDLTLDADSVATYLGMLVGLGAVLTAFEAPGLLIYRRRTGAAAGIRALPWTLPAAVLCVAVSRLASLEPGYLYGIVIGLVFRDEISARDEGRQNAAGAAWTLLVVMAAWIGLDWVRGGESQLSSFGGLLLETALAIVVVGGLEAVAFGLLPMRFLAGATVYAWNRAGWALLFGVSAFAFIHLLIGPHTGYLAELSPGALAAAVGAFAAFGAFSVLFWAYFRFRPARLA